MNLKLASQKLSQATLAITLGILVCPDSAQASLGQTQENLEVAQPTLLIESSQESELLAETSSINTSAVSETASDIIIASEQNSNINDTIVIRDSNSQLETESISIPVAIEKNSNKTLANSIDIPVVPAVDDQLVVKQTNKSIVVDLENLSESNTLENQTIQPPETLVSQKIQEIEVINPANKQNSQKSSANPDLVSSVPVQIEYYDPTTSPSVENMISPNLPEISSPEPYLPEESNTFKGYIWPAKGVFTSGYGWRWGRMHKGIDIAAPIGTPIVAAADGKIVNAGWNSGGYGNLVKIKHFDGSITLYAHNSKILVRNGQFVKQGQQIAKMGSTGFSTGPHLHFEIHSKGKKAINPVALLPKKR